MIKLSNQIITSYHLMISSWGYPQFSFIYRLGFSITNHPFWVPTWNPLWKFSPVCLGVADDGWVMAWRTSPDAEMMGWAMGYLSFSLPIYILNI